MATALIWARPDDEVADRHPYHPEPSKRRTKRGGVVAIKDDPAVWGSREGPSDFVRLTITDRTAAQLQQYLDRWDQVLSFRVDNHNVPQDRFDVSITAANRRASDGLGGVTQAQVEGYMTGWNATVMSASAGEVQVRFTILELLTARRFWEVDLTDVAFSEQSYDRNTGIHVVRADYAAKPWAPDGVESRVAAIASVVAHDKTAKLIDYSMGRDEVLTRARDRLRQDVEQWVAKNRWYLDEAQVDTMLAGDGTASMTASEATALLKDATQD